MGKTLISAFAVVMLITTPLVHATVVTWQLRDVTFFDGGSASGFFTLDDQTVDFITDFDIRTTAGATLPAFEYTPASTESFSIRTFDNTAYVYNVERLPGSGARQVRWLFLSTASPFINGTRLVTSGTLPLILNGTSDEWISNPYSYRFRYVTGGAITAVPEPFTVAFLGIGAGLLMRLHRRRVFAA